MVDRRKLYNYLLCVYERLQRGTMNSELHNFGSALQSEDDVGKVIRAHIFIESAVADFLDAALCDSSHLKGANLNYSQKMYVAIACGLRSDLKGALKFIGTLRNGFAHELNRRIDKQNMNNWYKEFS
jgi:hypothetical protein